MTEEAQAHQFELGFSTRGHTDGLDALFSSIVVEEPKECLMRLYTISSVFLDYLESKLEAITLGKRQWNVWFLDQRNPVGRALVSSCQYGSDEPRTVQNVIVNRWRK